MAQQVQADTKATINAFTEVRLPQTSLVICSRNRPNLLLETVESVLHGNEVPSELVIVDQSDLSHPTLATLKTDRPSEIRYLRANSVGLSRARNKGIREAKHDIVIFIDDDMFATPRWYTALIRALVDNGVNAVVTGRVLPTTPEVPGGFVPATVVSEAPALYQGRIGADVLAGGHMATYRSILIAVGGFDERLGAGGEFPAADDNDLGFRLLEAGHCIIYVPDAVLYHRAWRGKNEYLRLRWFYGWGKGGYYSKHLSLRDPYMLRRMVWDISQRIFLFPFRLYQERRKACGDIVYTAGIFFGTTQWILKRLIKRQTATAPTSEA